MAPQSLKTLSRRERQIMDIIYQMRRAGAAEVLARMPDPPSYSAVRAMLRVLEDKGHLRHELDGTRYVYAATLPLARARRSALTGRVETFFDGSTEQAMAALLDLHKAELSAAELDRLAALIARAKQEGR